MNIPWSDLKKYSENKFGSHLKHRLQLVHYIESISANKIIYWMEKYDLDYFCHFDAAEQINDFLGPGIYLYVNSVTDVMYVGCSDEMRKQLQRPDEYKMDECIITMQSISVLTLSIWSAVKTVKARLSKRESLFSPPASPEMASGN